jgi:hypothetical protein
VEHLSCAASTYYAYGDAMIIIVLLVLAFSSASGQVTRLVLSSGHATPESSRASVRLVAAQPLAGIMDQPGIRWGFLPLRAERPTSVQDAVPGQRLAISPTPASHVVTLQGLYVGQPWHIVDMLGIVVHSGNAEAERAVIDVAALPAGLYTVCIPGGKQSIRFIIAR